MIYTDKSMIDLGALQDFSIDLAFGIDENNFELSTGINNHVCEDGSVIYMEGTEYGGIVDGIRVETDLKKIVYKGYTWHGILESKVIEPDAGNDYLVVSGDANAILRSLIERLNLQALFQAKNDISGITVKNYYMNRYVKGYTGIKKMLDTVKGKLKFNFEDGHVVVWAEPYVDYSKDDEFDSSQIDFVIEKKYKPTNHMICLGKGELKDREVIHLYADKDGNISKIQSMFGLDERTDIYDNSNAESLEALEKDGTEALQKAWSEGELQLDLDATTVYDIGDIVGAKENVTGITMSRPITKKIVTIKNNIITITHKVGE